MCGIAGSCNFTGERIDYRLLKRMNATLVHRGPDDEGIYLSSDQYPDARAQAGLGHRRLKIIDLETGHQPMSNEDESIWIVFNGEIYNFLELKETLSGQGHRFKTKSDTEVILHLYEEDDLDCVRKLRGMFAFAIWDNRKQRLFLARDRVGKKPLVYHFDGQNLIFASEMKAVLQGEVEREIDPEAIDYFLTYGYIPSPKSILKAVKKLPPAHLLVYDCQGVRLERYWQITYRKRKISFAEAKEQLKGLLTESIRLRLISDVPLGAFLSGGMDSSSVVAIMSRLSSAPVKTFTVGFAEADYSELSFARRVARQFNTEHHEFVVKPDALEVLPKLVWHYNEPFGDSSCIPTYYVAKMARSIVPVALNGDGGDESFAGYERYRAIRLGGLFEYFPRPLVQLLFNLYRMNKKLFIQTAAFVLRRLNTDAKAEYIERFLKGLLSYPDVWKRYISWISCFPQEQKHELYNKDFQAKLNGHAEAYILDLVTASSPPDLSETAMQVEINSYLPEDLLVKMDIAAMASSLEARSPLLDHHLMEFAASLPIEFKMRCLRPKYILKELARDLLPQEILSRKKMGFAIPVDKWFRQELRQFSSDMLLDARCVGRGYFRKEFIQELLNEHASGEFNHGAQIWSLLNLEIWHRTFIDQTVPQELS